MYYLQDENSVENVVYQKTKDYKNYCFIQLENEKMEYAECVSEKTDNKPVRTFLAAGMIISLAFLVLTFVIYVIVAETRTLHTKCLMCYIISLIIFYAGLVIVNSNLVSLNINATGPCIFLGYFLIIGGHFCFFWLNVMCYDIWHKFKIGMRQRSSGKTRFICYCCYAFGIPILFTLCIFLIDEYELLPLKYRPSIGSDRCWVRPAKRIEMIYVFIPITIILAINIIFYSVTAYTIYRIQKETAVLFKSDDSRIHSKINKNKETFMFFVRLFLIAGISWTMEVISYYLGDKSFLFHITDFINCVQGLIIFLLFVVWNSRVKTSLIQKLQNLTGMCRSRSPPEASIEDSDSTESYRMR